MHLDDARDVRAHERVGSRRGEVDVDYDHRSTPRRFEIEIRVTGELSGRNSTCWRRSPPPVRCGRRSRAGSSSPSASSCSAGRKPTQREQEAHRRSSAAAPAARWSPTGCAGASTPTRPRSTSSTATTVTSISRGCSSCPFGLAHSTRSCGRAGVSSRTASIFHENEVDRGLDRARRGAASTTAPCFPTTRSSSRAASGCSPRRPRA